MKADFLMLAHKYIPHIPFIGGWLLSEKLDGIRVFWDGGITRGIPASQIPWANTDKDYRLKEEVVSTGLWSRYGKVIRAPGYWLDKLPEIPLDGELFIDNNSWQTLSSIVKRFEPDHMMWGCVKFMVLDSPPINRIFADREIKTTNFKKNFQGINRWLENNDIKCEGMIGNQSFEFIYEKLKGMDIENENIKIHNQIEVPLRDSHGFIEEQLKSIVEQGGEGIVLRNPSSIWEPHRSHNLLKYKPYLDGEATVMGFIFGRKTDLGSKLLGKMGAMITSFNGKRLELSGFTDTERQLVGNNVEQLGEELAGKEVPIEISNPMFPRGSKVTIRYRELSDSGVPKECRFLRKDIR